jgi:membrane associated rhomboid family serine protease
MRGATARWIFGAAHSPVALLWAVSILLAWLTTAVLLDQPVWQPQHSRDLIQFGAERGAYFEVIDSWKIIASQWLHVKPAHMLFNVLVIAVVGSAVEQAFGWRMMLCVGIGGGALAQLATLILQPQAYISGASQAYLALCAFAMLLVGRMSVAWWAALAGIATSIILDVFVSAHGGVKVGHVVALATGFFAGACTLIGKMQSSVVKR